MNRTHAFFALAAALTLSAAFPSLGHWWTRRHQPPVAPAGRADVTGGTLKLDAALSHARPLEGGSTYARYDVRASDARLSSKPQPVQMALVVDRSGSMSGQKLDRAKAAAHALIDLLAEDDSLAVVTFGSDVTALPMTRADLEGKGVLHGFVNQIADSGSTNISGALLHAQALLNHASGEAIRRVVLMSDGQPTEGMTREEDLVGLAAQMHEGRLAVSALGIGTDFNGPLMQHLAERGGGFYAYLNDPSRLTEVLQLELTQARGAVARNVALKLTLKGETSLVQVAGREVVRNGDEVTVPLPDFAPGQNARAFVELKVPAGAPQLQVDARLEYVDVEAGAGKVTPTAHLAANTTDDRAVYDASKDAAVASDCIAAIGATQMVAAAAAFERGDRQSAFAFLGNARNIFAMSADSLAGDIDDATATQKRWEQTHDAEAIRHESLNLTRKKMANFGMANSY